jgi:hypothetical protein
MSERLLEKLVSEGVDAETIKEELGHWRNTGLLHLASLDHALMEIEPSICSQAVVNELRLLVASLYSTFENKQVIPSSCESAFDKLQKLVLPLLNEQLKVKSRR